MLKVAPRLVVTVVMCDPSMLQKQEKIALHYSKNEEEQGAKKFKLTHYQVEM
jgi:hypothetical protein